MQRVSAALMYAVPNVAETDLLLKAGADPNAKDKRGATPMTVAVIPYDSTAVLKLLVAKGAKVEGRLMPPVAQKGNIEAMRYLLSLGVSPGTEDDTAALNAALGSGCDACVRLLIEKGAPANGGRGANGQGSVLSQAAKRALTDLSQLLFEHGAPVDVRDRDGYTLLMQAVVSMEPPADRDRMVEWLLSKGADPNAKSLRGETAYLLASRAGATTAMELLAKAGAKTMLDQFPAPQPAPDHRAAVARSVPLLEVNGEAVFSKRGCVSCHSNSLTAMTVALARQKGFNVNEAQAKKELGLAINTEQPFLQADAAQDFDQVVAPIRWVIP